MTNCNVSDCPHIAKSFGLCEKHYFRQRRHGDVNFTSRRPDGTGSINWAGYKVLYLNGKRIMEHRAIWESLRGPIPPGFVLHHINGDKLDNRLENLELLTQSLHVKRHSKWDGITCQEPGCHEPAKKRGFCRIHYGRFKYCYRTEFKGVIPPGYGPRKQDK